jgi:hypothetical protein
MAQLVVIVQILVTKGYAMDALSNQCLHPVFDPVLPAAITEAGRYLTRQTKGAIGLAQQQRARIRGHCAAVKRRCDLPASKAGKIEGILTTLRLHRGHPLLQPKSLSQKNFR